ncbi:hypothetical protein MMC32_000352 [Xylographa parallela]|nr:hypothetical protein [Xylographa parallela]
MAAGIPCLSRPTILVLVLFILLHASPALAFGAGNIASIAKIEGINWRHGDIEDVLKTIAFIKGHKWTTMMVKRVYFGNWLRDYSQAVDVGSLKGVQADTVRILVWVLSFLTFGYATGEFEVTADRLGVYRPEEHIDNPKDYADNADARQYDERLRPPVQPIELQIDSQTGMKNYIANDSLGIATSSGYIKHSFTRSIHYGRVYTSGPHGTKGKDADLFEAMRCLGQGLHCLEDFGAHTNYTELTLRELGFKNVFTHTGTATEIDLHGKRVFPLVTGTFGAVDFLLSVMGEAQDHFTQSEVEELDLALDQAQTQSQASADPGSRSFGEPAGSASYLTGLLKQVPGAGSLCRQAEQLQESSEAQERSIESNARSIQPEFAFQGPPGSVGGPPGPGVPGLSPDFDPKKTIAQIYPILEFRDKVVKLIDATIEKIPGLEALVEKITETVTLFVMSLLAPFIRPIINAVSMQLKAGSTTVVDSSGKHQYEPWTDPHCTDPTHSLLSKDHFSNVLNEPAGKVAATILKYVAPRILYAWEHPDIPVDQVLNDIMRVFHHPANRDPHCELHREMFSVVENWAFSQPNRGAELNNILSSDGVRHGKNNVGDNDDGHHHGSLPPMGKLFSPAPKPTQGDGMSRDTIDPSYAVKLFKESYPGTETTNDGASPSPVPPGSYAYGQPSYPPPAYGQGSYAPQAYPYGAPPEQQQPYRLYGSPAPPPVQEQAYELYGSPAPPQGLPPAMYGGPPGPQNQYGGQYAPPGYPPGPPYGFEPDDGPSGSQRPYGYGDPASEPGRGYYGSGKY